MHDEASSRDGLRLLRLRAALTQEELANKAGIGVRTIRDIESGRVRPQPKTVRLLSEALNLNRSDLAALTSAPGRGSVAPRELPRAPTTFAGRDQHLESLLSAVDKGAEVITVHGMAGVGKTSLALLVAHTLAPRYPDGQVFMDLHGFAHSAAPRPDPRSAITRVLRCLGGQELPVPVDFDELTAHYRSFIADQRVLLVFDNVTGSEQLEALLPGTPGSLVLATSRRDIALLSGAHSVPLEPPSMSEAVAMLNAAVPDRMSPQDATAIAERCGRLPLAIGLAAARLRSRPHWLAQDLLTRLSDDNRLLDELDMGHPGVSAALRASYLELDPAHQRLLRLLGSAPGIDVDSYAAAALCDLREEDAGAMLESLVDVHLVETRPQGRYRLHDLVRIFAARLARLEDPQDDTEAALSRLIDVYLHFASHGAARVWPDRLVLKENAAAHDLGLPRFPDRRSAVSWFQTERGNLQAAVTAAEHLGWLQQAWHLAWAFATFMTYDPDIGPHALVSGIALDSARRLGDRRKEAHSLGDIGRQLLVAGKYREAIGYLDQSVALKRDLGEFGAAALTLRNIGLLHRRSGRFQASLEVYESALAMAAEGSSPEATVHIGVNMALPLLRLGRLEEAERRLADAERNLSANDDYNRLRIDVFRGTLARERGAPADAAAIHLACLTVCEREGIPAGIANSHIELGEDLLRLGRLEEAVAHLDHAVEFATELGDPSLETSPRNSLGRALTDSGSPEKAVEHHERAAVLSQTHGDAYELARAHHGLAEAHRHRGDIDGEQRYLRLAVHGYSECGVPEAEVVAKRLNTV